MSEPLVSVVLSVYNGEEYLEEAMRSVLAQTYKQYELIVIDDGSTSDACARMCRKYTDKVRYIRQDNQGLSAGRNTGIRQARGEYVAFIDHDDIWLPEMLEKQVGLFEGLRRKGVTAGMVYCLYTEIDADGRETDRSCFNRSGNIFSELIESNGIGPPCCVMTRKDVLENTGYFDAKIRSYSDWDLYIRIAFRYEIHCVIEHLARYRITSSSLSQNLQWMEEDMRIITERVLASYPDFFSKRRISRKSYLRSVGHHAAMKWKNAAYERLFVHGDGPGFRRCIRKGWAWSHKGIGLKTWICVALSYMSASFCRRLGRLKGPAHA